MKKLKLINSKNDVRLQVCEFMNKYLSSNCTLYDIGCGSKPFAYYTKDRVKEHIGVDIEDSFYNKDSIDIIGSADDIPVDDNSADIVLSSQVLEHLENPQKAISEMSRILKKDGYFICSFPFLYPLHAIPRDYQRISEYAIDNYLISSSLKTIELKKIGGFWYAGSLFSELYLQTFQNTILGKLGIIKILSLTSNLMFTLIHSLEGFFFSAISKKHLETVRDKWTVNYVLVAKKC